MWNDGYGHQMGMMYDPAMHVLMSLFWVCVGILIVIAIKRYHRRRKHQCHHGRGAVEVLRERYAKGEIDTVEFEERKKTLMEGMGDVR